MCDITDTTTKAHCTTALVRVIKKIKCETRGAWHYLTRQGPCQRRAGRSTHAAQGGFAGGEGRMRSGFHASAATRPGRRRHQRAEHRSRLSLLHEAEKGGGEKTSSGSNNCVPNTTVQTPKKHEEQFGNTHHQMYRRTRLAVPRESATAETCTRLTYTHGALW